MEPFIQLSYGEQCPRKSSKLTETSFIDKRKVPEKFWLDLLDAKCPEGLGEVSESLVKDQNLTPADFLNDPHLSPKISDLQENSNDCHLTPKPEGCNEFKTPLTSRYGHKVSETPSLFSQDDQSINATPLSGLKCSVRTQSQPTCHGDTESVQGSPVTPWVLSTPAALCRHRSGDDPSKRRAKTPDLLAEIMGQRRSSLSGLLAGGDGDEVAEWSDSMATPPLKISSPAAEVAGGERETNEESLEEEGQPSSKRIARVLFSASTTNRSMEPLELSLDDTITDYQPLDPLVEKEAKEDSDEKSGVTEESCLVEEVLLEYSCDNDTKYRDQDCSKNLLEESIVASPSGNKFSVSEEDYDGKVTFTPMVNVPRSQNSELSINPSPLHSPFSNSFLSPPSRAPLKALAQSTPKPSISTSAGFHVVENGQSLLKERHASLPRNRDSLSLLCDKARIIQSECGVTCLALEENCKLFSSDVTFGSPSRSFELAMAREADKLCSRVERDSRTSGLGSSLSSSLIAQSPQTDDALNRTKGFQLTEVRHCTRETPTIQDNVTGSTAGTQTNQVTEPYTGIRLNQATTTKTPINHADNTETSGETPRNQATDSSPGSPNDWVRFSRAGSFCKVPGLRRSVKSKRFLYPTASQVAKQDTGKRCKEITAAVNNSLVMGKEKSITINQGNDVVSGDKTLDNQGVCNMSSDKGGEGEMPAAKRPKIYEKGQGSGTETGAAPGSLAINGECTEDEVLFDMDALSQFPVDSILSPPSLRYDSDSLNVDTSSSRLRHEMNVTFTITSKEKHKIVKSIDSRTSHGLGDARICNYAVPSDKKTMQNEGNSFHEREEKEGFEEPGSCSYLRTNSSCFRSESNNAGFHTAGGKVIEISEKALINARALLEELDQPVENSTINFVSQECDPDPSTIEMNGVCNLLESSTKIGKEATLPTITQTEVNRLSSAGNGIKDFDLKGRAELYISKRENLSDFKEQHTGLPAFCGFSTASGKQVRVSEAAMKQARKTLSEIDTELKADTGEKDPSNVIKKNRSASEKELGAVIHFQEVPCNGIGNDFGSSLPGSLDGLKKYREYDDDDLDLCKMGNKEFKVLPRPDFSDMGLCEAVAPSCVQANSGMENNDAVLENAGKSGTKKKDSVNDSLLEDLLNDCKRRRRDSMDMISEENERMEEQLENQTFSPKLNNLRLAADSPEALKRREGIETDLRLDATSRDERTPIVLGCSGFQTASGKSVSVSEEALIKARNTWKKIDEKPTSIGADILPNMGRAEVCSFHTVPASVVETLEGSSNVGKSNVNQIEEQQILGGRNEPIGNSLNFSGFRTAGGKAVEISEGALQRAHSTMKEINDEIFADGQSNSRLVSPSSHGFKSVFHEADDNLEEASNTRRQSETNAKGGVYNEGQCKRAARFSSFSGFQTARGKNVPLSEEALKTGRDIMKRLAASEDQLRENNETSSLVFTETGSHFADAKNISISKQGLKRGRKAVEESEGDLRKLAQIKTEGARVCRSGFHRGCVKGGEGPGTQPLVENHFMEAEKESKSIGFSGFHTASGKQVDMSEEALQKGAKIMQQIDVSLKQGIVNGGQNVSVSGFTNATGKSSMLSEEALCKGAQIMKEVDQSLGQREDNTGTDGGSLSGCCGILLAAGKGVKQQIDRSLDQSKETDLKTTSLSGFLGFKTASGQSVKMSEESLERGAAIMQEIDKSLDDSKGNRPNSRTATGFSGFQTASGQNVKLSKESLEKGAAIMQQIDKSLEDNKGNSIINNRSTTDFSGFQTTSGQKVQMLKESLEKGAAIMEQIDKSLEESKGQKPSESRSATGFSAFQTASGQSVEMSKESLEKGAAIMQQIDKSLEESRCNKRFNLPFATGFSGFQTASGQSVKLSKESLEKGAAIMQQIDKSLEESRCNKRFNLPFATGFSGFQTASGQSVKLSKESLEKGAAIMQQIDRSLEDNKGNSRSNNRSETGFSGFQTASGRGVKLSKESLEKGAEIMQQVNKSLAEGKGNKPFNSRSATGFSGFQTASGRGVKLSKDSLEKGAEIMQQIDKSLAEGKGNKPFNSRSATGFSGFQTASGQNVKLSKESLEKGAAIMQNIDKSLEDKVDKGGHSTTSFGASSCFQTADGKTLQISESALAKAKETMAGIDREISSLSSESETLGFQTASKEESINKIEHVSSTAKGQAKFSIEGVENNTILVKNNGDAGDFKGFFTAGGQKVSVSEEVLSNARAFFLETDNDLSDFKIEQGTGASLRECTEQAVSVEARGKIKCNQERRSLVEHDEAVSREILESSEALLADESFMDVSEYLHDKQERSVALRSSLNTPRPAVSLVQRDKGNSHAGVASGCKIGFARRHSTPLRCSEEMFKANHSATRNGMKPCTTTPSGVLHDRRARSFHVPLRARQASVENLQGSCASSSRRYSDADPKNSSRISNSNRCLRPLQALTPGCFKSKADSFPRTSTPLNRRTPGPRPQFITPYRKQEANSKVSPLARCSSSRLSVGDSLEGQESGVMEPSSKKPRITVSNNTLNKNECRVKPQPGFLSSLRRHHQRIKLREFVGNATPGGFSAAELNELGVSLELLSVTSSNARSFRFDGRKYFSEAVLSSKEGVRTEDGGILHLGTDGSVGLAEIQSAFLTTPGVDRQLISEEWIANHFGWIVWKLAAMEVAFPQQFAGRCLTPDWVLCQLKYRYDREIDNSNRSALKKILERDDVSSRPMVLCVSNVSVTDNQSDSAAQEKKGQDDENDAQGNAKKTEQSSAVIELTDGWYGIRCLLDRPLTKLLNDRKLVVGQKLCVYGAELVGSEQAVPPLEAPSSLMLRLHANSTRRARWDAKLGFHSHTHAFPLPLVSLFGDGGFTGCVDVIVLRQYPVQWMEKMPDGTNIFRNSRLEEREAKRFEADRHQRREKLFLKIQEEFEKEYRQPETERRRSARFRRRSFSSDHLRLLHDGKEIYEALTQASDPDAVKEYLDERQIRALEDYKCLLQERKCAELQSKFERVWKEQQEERQLQRNVVPLLKVRIADYLCKGQAKQHAVLSIWRPSEEVMHLLSEGSRLRIYHLTAVGLRFRQGTSELQLSATRTTRYEALTSDADVARLSYVPRQACSFGELRCGSSQQCSEVDIVGLVVFCSPLSSFSTSSSSIQTVYLSDEHSNLVAVKFWGGMKAVAVEDLVKLRSFICCSNLSVRPDERLQCPSLSFGELSSLTLKPREPHLRSALNKLQQDIPDLNLFMAGIQEKLTAILRPHRASPSADVKVNTVRMYGKSADTAPTGWIQKFDSAANKQSPDAMNTSPSSGKESCSSFNGEEDRSVGFAQSAVCNYGREETHEFCHPRVEEHSDLAATCVKSSKAKRKLLDCIAEPPPLSPLPSPIPVSVRREFKRPRQVGNPGNVRPEQ